VFFFICEHLYCTDVPIFKFDADLPVENYMWWLVLYLYGFCLLEFMEKWPNNCKKLLSTYDFHQIEIRLFVIIPKLLVIRIVIYFNNIQIKIFFWKYTINVVLTRFIGIYVGREILCCIETVAANYDMCVRMYSTLLWPTHSNYQLYITKHITYNVQVRFCYSGYRSYKCDK